MCGVAAVCPFLRGTGCKKKKKTWFLYLSYRTKHKEIIFFFIVKEKIVKFYANWRFHDHVLGNYAVHTTRNYVFMAIKTY